MEHASHGFNSSSIGWALVFLSFLPRKRVRNVKWSSLFKMQHADANFGPAYNEFATIAIKMVYNPPQKNNSNGPIFMYDLLKSCLTLHSMFDVGSKSNGHKFELLPHENGFPIPP
jgi:hypothetical protein